MAEFASFFSSSLFFAAAFDLVVNAAGKNFQIMNPLLLLAVGLLSYASFRLLLRKERSGAAVLETGALCCVCGIALVFFCFGTRGFGAWAILISGIIYECWQGYQLCMRCPEQNSLIGRLDGVLILLILFLLIEQSGTKLAVAPVWYGFGGGFCAAAAIVNRVRSQNQAEDTAKGVGRVSLAAVLISAAAAGLAAVAARPLGKAFVAVLNAVWAALKWLGRAIGIFFLWLLSLFPATEEGLSNIEVEEGIGLSGPAEEAVTSDALIVKILVILIAVCLLVVLILTLRHMRLKRGKREIDSRGRMIARESLWQSLHKALKHLVQKVRYRIRLLLGRNTVIGTYLNMEQLLKHSSLARRKGETIRSFLKRCEIQAGGQDPETAAALHSLAEKVDLCCYFDPSGAKERFAASFIVCRWAQKQNRLMRRNKKAKKSTVV